MHRRLGKRSDSLTRASNLPGVGDLTGRGTNSGRSGHHRDNQRHHTRCCSRRHRDSNKRATGVATSRTTSSAGVYEISPLIVGTYTITVSASGFDILKQEGDVLNEN